ncbi:MAG: insulinase family protein [Clostridia bacterium]|nr:insulinase family protein [Clostridia bacterium]
MSISVSASLPEVVPKEVRLTPQVRLCYLPMEHCKGNYLSLRFLLPLGEMTSTYALLPYVLSRGSTDYPDIDAIDRAADLLYGAEITPMVGSEGEWQVIGFSASFLADRMAPDGCKILEGVLHLLSSLLISPCKEGSTLLPEYVESEKGKLCDRLRALKDNPDLYAIKRSEELMCAGEPYARYERGEESEVASVTPEVLTGAWQTLLHTAPLCITYAGDSPMDRLLQLLSSHFGSLTTPPAPLPPTGVVRQAKGELRRYTEKLPTGQCQLIIGLRSGSVIGDEDHAAFSLLYAMLSSAPTARLFTKVREERSLCYGCSALSDSHKGILLITCGLRRERLQEAEDAIFDQLSALAEGDFTDEEFESAKRWLMGRYPILEDSPIALAGWYFSRSPLGIAESPRVEAERISRVTREEVMQAAGRLSPDAIYTLLDRSRTRKEAPHEY